MTQRKRRTFTTEFKEQMVMLYINGKPRLETIKEYDLTASAFDKCIRQHQTTGSFKTKDKSPMTTDYSTKVKSLTHLIINIRLYDSKSKKS